MTNKGKVPTPSAGGPKKQGFVFKGFVSFNLNVSDTKAMKEWATGVSGEQVYDEILKWADSGYKFSVGETPNGLQASLSNIDGPPATVGYILSARASSPRGALLKLMYIHEVALGGDWMSAIGGDDPDGF